MANEEHVKILKQGVDVWNKWREDTHILRPNLQSIGLSGANLAKANLIGVDLRGTDLSNANLQGVGLHHADMRSCSLVNANLTGAYMRKTDLSEATLLHCNLTRAKLQQANLTNTYCSDANFYHAYLSKANFKGAYLDGANLVGVEVENTNLSEITCGYTVFADVDLSKVIGLESVQHRGPSTIGIDTLYRSNGNIPTVFLEGCGISETMITFARSLVGQAIEYYSCFVSHSSRDDEFVNHLVSRMRDNRLRVWNDADDIKGGRKIHEQLYEAIHYHDKFIIVLSEASMNSKWVETEIRRARKRERDKQRRILFPIRLVSYETIQKWELFDADEGRDLTQEIREYYIPDFSNWKDYDTFKSALDRLIDDLRKAE